MIDSSTGQPQLDEDGKQAYFCGFSIGGGIDQDYKLSPQKYTDNVSENKHYNLILFSIFFTHIFVLKGIYVTNIKPDGPAASSNLRINDKILQVNGYDFTLVTHKKAVEYIKKGKTLNMLESRATSSNC